MLFRISKFVLIAALSSFVAVVLLDPSDEILHLKVPLLILTLCTWVARVVCGMVSPGSAKIWAAILLFALIFPGIATIIGLLGHTLPIGDPKFQLMKSFAGILLIPLSCSERKDISIYIIRWSFVIATFTLALFVLASSAPLLFAAVAVFTLEKGNAMLGSHSSIGLGIGSVYYKTISVIVFPVAYHLRNLLYRPHKIISLALLIIFLAAVLCSGSRGTLIGIFFVIVALVCQKLKKKFGSKLALAAFLIMLALPAGYFVSFFHPDESSNAAKIGHIRSYAIEFNEHPTYLLWGQGADTEFYTQGFQTKTALTELTYLDLIRWFGLPVAALILIAVFFPIFALTRQENASSYLAVPYFAYLWEAATNPLLVCSAGALVVTAIWGTVLTHSVKHTFATPAEVSS